MMLSTKFNNIVVGEEQKLWFKMYFVLEKRVYVSVMLFLGVHQFHLKHLPYVY